MVVKGLLENSPLLRSLFKYQSSAINHLLYRRGFPPQMVVKVPADIIDKVREHNETSASEGCV